MKKWLKRISLGLLLLLVVVTTVGAVYERVMRRRAAIDHPAPGSMVDVGGGRRLLLDCRGTGTPVVVLEAGLDVNGSLSWSLVHDSIARITRACAYGRAGMLWSDDKPGPHNAATIAADLKAGLTAAGEPGPYVMVGHSLGGPYIVTFTKHFPADVAGLVFVDASHPEQERRFQEAMINLPEPPLALLKVFAALAWTGLPRLMNPKDTTSLVAPAVNDAIAAYAPTSFGSLLAEMVGMSETMREAGTARTLGDRPLVVLTAMALLDSTTLAAMELTAADGVRLRAVWRALHDEEASWSSRSEHILVPDATHYIQIDRPDVVISAVRRVVDQVRSPVP